MKKPIAILCCVLFLVLCSPTNNFRAQTQDVVLVGAGDIARCGPENLAYPQATATLLDSLPGSAFAIGDLAYVDGLETEFTRCFDATWGRHRARLHPVPGVHDLIAPNAFGYFNYFGPAAGDPAKGYYSFNYGAWHVVVLNSVCTPAPNLPGGLFHSPLYSSRSADTTPAVQPFWQILYNAGADLVVNGHAHNYERFAPQDPNGNLDTAKGLREFVVGTGGESLAAFDATPAANSEVRNSTNHGVIQFTLHATSYDWQFIPVAGQTFTDSGTQACH